MSVKSPAVALVVLQPRDLTEVAPLCFQELVVARTQVAEVGSEDTISWERGFLLWEQSSPVNVSHNSKHAPAPPTPPSLSNGLPNQETERRPW